MKTKLTLPFGLFLLALLVPALARAQADIDCRPYYLNRLFDPAYGGGGASLTQTLAVTLFSGSAALSTTTYPGDGVVQLRRAVIGQPVGGVDYRIPGEHVIISQVIEPAPNLNARPGVAPFSITPAHAAVAINVGGRTNVYAAYEGDVEIRWVGMDGTVLSPITYHINLPPDPEYRVKLYHTHASSGDLYQDTGRIPDPQVCRVIFPAAAVNPVIHWNPRIMCRRPTIPPCASTPAAGSCRPSRRPRATSCLSTGTTTAPSSESSRCW